MGPSRYSGIHSTKQSTADFANTNYVHEAKFVEYTAVSHLAMCPSIAQLVERKTVVGVSK